MILPLVFTAWTSTSFWVVPASELLDVSINNLVSVFNTRSPKKTLKNGSRPNLVATFANNSSLIKTALFGYRLFTDIATKFSLKPFLGIFLGDLMLNTDTGLLVFTSSNPETRTTQNNIEVHAVNTNRRIIF